MTNWSNPTLTSLYTDFLSQLKERDDDLALQFDGVTVSNIPTGAIRWNSSVNRWQKWNGSAWAELTSTYALTGLSTTGNASIGGTLSVTGSTTLAAATATTPATGDNSTAVATTAFVRAQGYATLASPALTGTPTAPTAATSTNTTQLATTAFVVGQISNDALLKSGGTVSGALTVTGTANLGGNLTTGTGVSTGDAAIELGGARSGNGPAYVDFHSQAGTDFEARLLRASGANGAYELVNNGTGTLLVSQTGAAPIRFQTSNTPRVEITSGGLVGIGTSAPGALLDVFGGLTLVRTGAKAVNSTYLLLKSTDASNAMELQFINSANQAWEIQSVEQNVAYRNIVLNRYGGNVGIGISAPGYILDCSQSVNNDAAINITNSNASSGAIAQFRASNGTSSAWYGIGGTGYTGYAQIRPNGAAIYTSSAAGIGLSADNASGYITFGTGSGASEKARIDSSGRLGIGVSAPSSILDIKAASNGVDTLIVRPNTTSNFITFKPETASGQFDFGYWTGSAWGTAKLNAETFVVGGASERLRITSAGALALANTSANANVGFRHSKAITGATTSFAQYIDGTVQTDVTVSALGVATSIGTAASTSLTSLVHYQAATGSLGAGTSITNQIAFSASSSIDGATNDFGFYGNIGAGSGNWNCYMVGAAPNFFNGQVQIGAGSVSAPSVSTNGDTNTGIYFPSADTLAFVEGGSEAARIDDGGRFLRGSSANYGSHGIQNHSSGLLGSAIASSGWYSGASNCPQFILNRSFSNGIVGDHIVVAEGDRLGDLLFRGSDGTDFRDAARITCAVDAIPASNSVPGRISFHVTASGGTSLTERMRLTNSGQLGIGTTSPTNTLDVNANSIRVRTARTPASSSASGNAGEICWDANYIYVCTATNTWRRAALSTW